MRSRVAHGFLLPLVTPRGFFFRSRRLPATATTTSGRRLCPGIQSLSRWYPISAAPLPHANGKPDSATSATVTSLVGAPSSASLHHRCYRWSAHLYPHLLH